MFRRSRFSVKPNVRPAAAGRSSSSHSNPVARGAAAPDPDAPPDSGSAAGPSVAGESSAVGGSRQAQEAGSGRFSRDENTSDASCDGDGSKRSETVLQRRKRIPTAPNLAKPRVAVPSTKCTISLVSKCPQKPLAHPPASGSPAPQKESPEKVNIENSSVSPIFPEKKTPVPQVPQFSPLKKSVSKESNACAMAPKSDDALQKSTSSPLKERPTQERLIQEEMPPSKSSPAKEKKINSEQEKILKAQKLRKLLTEELRKEKQRKYKHPIIEKCMPEDRSKMLMRDFIYYLPENNPMKSSLVEEKKTEKTSTVMQAKELEQKAVADHEDENEEAEEGGGEEDSPLLVPRVKVAEDGSIILDEESLTVEVLRTKGQCVVEENDPIFERGSTTTYSSFRKSYYTKPWSEKETDMFFLALSMVGTDFSMISQLFPHRARSEIKNKFKREEKINGWRIDKAFKERVPFDFELFGKLLEKVMENEKRKKEKDAIAKCQSSKEKIPKERTPKFQKKQKDVSGQPNHGHVSGQPKDDHQNGRISDAEMEVDSGTAEKENEESLSILEQAEGQTASESGLTKKKRKRKKKDSEQETENASEERIISAEMSGGERAKKKRKNASSSAETNSIVTEDLEKKHNPDEETRDLVEPQYIIQLNEEAKRSATVAVLSVQPDAFTETEFDEFAFLEARFEHHIGQLSKSSPSTSKIGFEETTATKNDVAELNKLDENCSIPTLSHDDEMMETGGATSKKPTVQVQLQKFQLDITSGSERVSVKEPQINDTPEVKTLKEKFLGDTEKVTVENKDKASGPIIKEMIERTNSGLDRESQEIQKTFVEKVEARGHQQKPKPNIVKVPSRKDTPVQDKLEGRILCQEPDGKVGKSNDLNDVPNSTAMEISERNCQSFDTEAQKSLLQESNKIAILKSAPLARGRMQRPKPNLARFVRRPGATRNTRAEGEKLTEAITETEKMHVNNEYSHDELIKDTAKVATYEADTPHSERLENKDESCSKEIGSACTSHPPAQEPDYENCELKNTSLSSISVEDVSDLAAGVSSLQKEQKEIAAETEHSLKNYPLNQKEYLGKVEETKIVENNHETEKGSIELMSECSKYSNLNETAKCEIPAPSHLLKQHSADAQDAIATHKTHQCPQNLSDINSGGLNKISLPSDILEETSLGKRNSPEKGNRDAIRSPLLFRGRFQRPKPNIGQAVGRKESAKKNEAIVAIAGTKKSEMQTSATISSTIPPLRCDDKVLSAEALENRLVDTEILIQEDCQIPSTSRIILNQCVREKSTFQEDKSCTIKPAQLVRGRFWRARPNLGRMGGKKEEPVSKNASASVGRGLGKSETEVISKGDLNSSSVYDIGKSSSESLKEKKCTETTEAESSKRSPPSGKYESSEQLSESESQTGKDISQVLSAQEKASETLKRKQPERLMKQRKSTCETKTALSTPECETDHNEKGRRMRKVKPNVSRGKNLKPALGKRSKKEFGSSKVNLVTLRASSQEEEDDDDADDFEPDYEIECFSPEEVNKAPVFVPKGLRSPNPVPVQIEETMEELEIYENVTEESFPDQLEIYENVTEESCVGTTEYLCPELNVATEPVIQGDKELLSSLVVISQKEPEEKTGINDGSTEAAMTLLAMRDPVFQLNTTQETQELPNQELTIADGCSKELNEEQSIFQNDLPLSALSKHELVSSQNTNITEPQDPSTSGLEECSQEATTVCSDLSSSKEKTLKLARCRFPNLSRSLSLKRKAPQKSFSPSLDVAQSNTFQNEEQVSKNVTEEEKVELEQNLHLDELPKSISVSEHNLQSGSHSQAMQENNNERQDRIMEIREGRSDVTLKPSPKAEICLPELPCEPSEDINVQLSENNSGPAEYQLSAVDIAQTDSSKQLSVSATTETTAVSCSIVECPGAEEEQTFILTLVEVSTNSEGCSDDSTSLQHASEKLLPAAVFFTSNDTESVELTRENSIRSATATVEENAASVDNPTETEELERASAKHFVDPISPSWENQKRDAVDLEQSVNHLEKEKSSFFAGENLKNSNKETSLKLRCLPRKVADKNSEKLTISKKKNSTSSLVHETSELQVNCEQSQSQSSLNLEAVLLDEAASSDVQESTTLYVGKAKTSGERRSFVNIWKSRQSEQLGNSSVLPKMSLSSDLSSRPSQKSLGFLPLICKKDNTDEEGTTKGNKLCLQKPLALMPKSTALSPRDKKEETPFQQEQFPSSSFHSNSSLLTTYSSEECENVSSSTVQFHSDLSKNEGSSKEQGKDEEPTKISEYFFSDIFMEVDDSE